MSYQPLPPPLLIYVQRKVFWDTPLSSFIKHYANTTMNRLPMHCIKGVLKGSTCSRTLRRFRQQRESEWNESPKRLQGEAPLFSLCALDRWNFLQSSALFKDHLNGFITRARLLVYVHVFHMNYEFVSNEKKRLMSLNVSRLVTSQPEHKGRRKLSSAPTPTLHLMSGSNSWFHHCLWV